MIYTEYGGGPLQKHSQKLYTLTNYCGNAKKAKGYRVHINEKKNIYDVVNVYLEPRGF